MCDVQRRLVAKVESGEIKDGDVLDVAEAGLQSLVDMAMERRARRMELGQLVEKLVREGHTLGADFWTEKMRAQVSGALLEEYDDMLLEQLPDMPAWPRTERVRLCRRSSWRCAGPRCRRWRRRE